MSATTYRVESVHLSSANNDSSSGSMTFRDSSSVLPPQEAHTTSKAMQVNNTQPRHHRHPQHRAHHQPAAPSTPPRTYQPQLIATISAGFEKGDYLIREERGANVYFDFFEEAYNFACTKGYTRFDTKEEENEYVELIKMAHRSVPGGCRFNVGRLLMVLRKKLVPLVPSQEEDPSERDESLDNSARSYKKSSGGSSSSPRRNNNKLKGGKRKKLALGRSTNTISTYSETSSSSVPSSALSSSAYSSSAADTSYVDSWE